MGSGLFMAFEMRQHYDDDGVLRLSLIGELDLASADELEIRLRELESTGIPVRLDLSALVFVDSRGLRTLSVSAQAARRDGWLLEVEPGAHRQIQRVIELAGAARYLWPSGDPVARVG